VDCGGVGLKDQTGRWVCMFCGYVYDEEVGCPEEGIAPGTRWQDIPEDWCCPVCGAEKSDFKRGDSN
jgi:rubredoxin